MTNLKNQTPFIIFMSGASGTGKTTLLKYLASKYSNESIAFFHFDSIGVPPLAEMNERYGGPREWQQAKIDEWIKRLIYECGKKVVILEGQADLIFVESAFKSHAFENYALILIHCSDTLRHRRLRDRGHTELINADMDNWARYLHKQALDKNILILDSEYLSIDEMVNRILPQLAR